MAKNKKAEENQNLNEEEIINQEEVSTEDKEENQNENELEQDEKVINLIKENEELKNKVLRQMAEFDNFKKRTAKEKDEIFTYAKTSCVEQILGVIDNFERALDTECSDETFKKGVEMIFNQFKDTLSKLGVEEISALNEPFNPELHNAVNQIEDENFGENTVCQVFQKGYKIGDKVVRHSMVVVANP